MGNSMQKLSSSSAVGQNRIPEKESYQGKMLTGICPVEVRKVGRRYCRETHSLGCGEGWCYCGHRSCNMYHILWKLKSTQ